MLGTITAFLSEKQKFNCWGGKKGSQVETHNLFAYHDCLKELSTLFITVSLFTGVGYVHLPVMFNYCIFPLLGCLPYQTFVCIIIMLKDSCIVCIVIMLKGLLYPAPTKSTKQWE